MGLLALVLCGGTMPLVADDYELVWSDEFDVDGPLTPRDWTFEHGFVRNEEPQWYQEANAVVSGGNLVITAQRDSVPNPHYRANRPARWPNLPVARYSSACVTTQGLHELRYGRIEVRAKIPVASGAWPAIWTLGGRATQSPWPACGEVDMLEFYHNSIFANACWSDEHLGSRWNTVQTPYSHFTQRDAHWAERYHVWRLDWDSLSVRIYLDGEPLHVTPQALTRQPQGERIGTDFPFRQPVYLLLNLALRSDDGIDEQALPMKYYIDYVRFYKPKSTLNSHRP